MQLFRHRSFWLRFSCFVKLVNTASSAEQQLEKQNHVSGSMPIAEKIKAGCRYCTESPPWLIHLQPTLAQAECEQGSNAPLSNGQAQLRESAKFAACSVLCQTDTHTHILRGQVVDVKAVIWSDHSSQMRCKRGSQGANRVQSEGINGVHNRLDSGVVQTEDRRVHRGCKRIPVIVCQARSSAAASATSDADLRGLCIRADAILPYIGAVSRNVPSLLALVAKHCVAKQQSGSCFATGTRCIVHDRGLLHAVTLLEYLYQNTA